MAEERIGGLTALQAKQFLDETPRAILIDIRSNMEYLFVGHPVGSVHVPWIDEPDWVINPDFVTQIRRLLLGGIADKDGNEQAAIVLICRSGKRSLEAGKALTNAGFSEVYHVTEGFEGDLDDAHHRSSIGGWRYHKLPWEQC